MRLLVSRSAICAILTFAQLAVPGPTCANLFSATGADPRVKMQRNVYPYSAIGYVETMSPVPWVSGARRSRSTLTGTGFMISPCYALTAYHVVFGNDPASSTAALNHPVRISLGGNDTHFTLDRLPAMAVAWGDFTHDPDQDWAVLEVPGCPGGRPEIRWLAFAPWATSVESRSAEVGGFDVDYRPYRLAGQRPCQLGARIDDIVIKDFCASRPGMSGAPIMVREPDNILKAEAMVISEKQTSATPLTVNSPDQANQALLVRSALNASLFLPKIRFDRNSGDVFPIPRRRHLTQHAKPGGQGLSGGAHRRRVYAL